MLEQNDLRKIARLIIGNCEHARGIETIFNVIDKECNGNETSANDVYEEIIKSVLYGEKENK